MIVSPQYAVPLIQQRLFSHRVAVYKRPCIRCSECDEQIPLFNVKETVLWEYTQTPQLNVLEIRNVTVKGYVDRRHKHSLGGGWHLVVQLCCGPTARAGFMKYRALPVRCKSLLLYMFVYCEG